MIYFGIPLIALVVIGLVSVNAWIIGRQKALREARAELRAVVELELRTIARGDVELFRTRQDPQDVRWQEWQITRYLSRRAAQFVPAPGLVPVDGQPDIESIHLAGPDARVELIRWLKEPGDRSDPLPFQVTWFYRRDDHGVWRHVSPPEDYWGAPYSRLHYFALAQSATDNPVSNGRTAKTVNVATGPVLNIRATEAEAKLIDSIPRGLGNLLAEGCQLLECPEGARFSLSFGDVSFPDVRGHRWTLPALHLTGLPANRQARIAWWRAIKSWGIDALAQSQLDRQSLSDRVIYHQLVARLKNHLALRTPSPPRLEILKSALAEQRQHSLRSLWRATYDSATSEEQQLLEAEVAVLFQALEAQVGRERLFVLLPALNEHRQFDGALLHTYGIELEDFQAAWDAHLSALVAPDRTP